MIKSKPISKVLAVVLCAMMLMSVIPMSVFAEIENYNKDYQSATHTVFKHTEQTLAPGVTQYTNYAYTTADGKQMVYYVTTADVNRDDVIMQVSYKGMQHDTLGMEKLAETVKVANAKYSDPSNPEFISEYYTVVSATNGNGYNMTTGMPSGVWAMGGDIITDYAGGSCYLAIDGNAVSASKLATAHRITIGSFYQNFDGTSDISFTLSQIGAAATNHNHDGVYLPVSGTAAAATKLATARNITIGSASKSFDGSAAISFTLGEIGAAAASHTHSNYLSTSGGTVSGNLSVTGTLSAGTLSGVRKDYTGTLSTSWTGSAAPYTQNVTVSGILSTDRPILDMVCSGTYSTDQSREEGWLNIYRAVTAANRITFYAHEKPTVAINFYAQVTR